MPILPWGRTRTILLSGRSALLSVEAASPQVPTEMGKKKKKPWLPTRAPREGGLSLLEEEVTGLEAG
jgi:hypothetical protein